MLIWWGGRGEEWLSVRAKGVNAKEGKEAGRRSEIVHRSVT